MIIPQRGLKHIRTVLNLSNPQRKFFKLAILAAERVRRSKERKLARAHIEDLDSRLAEIDAETKDLMQSVDLSESNKSNDTPTIQARPVPRQTTAGFKLKY